MMGAMQKEQKISILLLNLFKEKKKKKDKQTNKQKKTSKVDWLPSL